MVDHSKAWEDSEKSDPGMKWTKAAGARIGIQFDPEEYDNKPEGSMSRELMKHRMYSRDVWIFRTDKWLQIEKETDWRSMSHSLQPLSNADILVIKYSVRNPVKEESDEHELSGQTQTS